MRSTELDLRGHRGGQIKTTCPLCSRDRKPANQSETCLSVNLDQGGWSCYNCGESGYLEDVKNVNGSAFVEKEKKNYKKPEKIVEIPKLPENVLEYFKGRGISEETLVHWSVRYGPAFKKSYPGTNKQEYIDGVPQFHKGIQFPFYENGELVWLKNFFPKEWSADGRRRITSFEGGKPVPFGLDNITNIAVCFEGEIDALSGHEAGVEGCFSVPNGSKALGFLGFESVVKKLLGLDRLIIAVDADEEGGKLQENLIRQISQLIGVGNIYLVSWPEGCKDANDVLLKFGPEYLKVCIEDMCYPLPVDGISEASEFFDEFMDFYDNGVPKGASTGMSFIDPIYRVAKGSMTTVTGATSQGKSELLDEIMRNMIVGVPADPDNNIPKQEGWKFAVYTPENSPHSFHMIKMAEKYIGKPYDTSRFGHMTRNEAVQASRWINESIFYINPRGKTYDVAEILDKARVLIYRKGINGLIIDPWNYVRKDFGGLREDQYINQELQKIGVFCKETGLHVWLVVHPRTLHKDKDGNISLPTLHDLSGGSKFGDNTDFAISFERMIAEAAETGIHKSRMHVIKSRNKYVASLGNVEMVWEPGSGRFRGVGDPVKIPMGEGYEDPIIEYDGGQGETRPSFIPKGNERF